MTRKATILASGFVLAGLAALPLVVGPGTLRVGSLYFLTLAALAGLHVVTGLTRIVSLSHAAFIGVGAYGAGIASLSFSTPPALAILAGIAAAAACSFLLALLTTRLEDHYLALGTLAAGEIFVNVFRGATSLTGGANGLVGVPPLRLFGIVLNTPTSYYPFCLIIGLAAIGLAWCLDRSGIGRSLRAMGDEGLLVESIGISKALLRVVGFTIGGSLAGLVGAVSAHIDGFVGPESYGVGLSITYLCFLVIGGLGKLQGVFLGAALASLGPDLFRGLFEWQMVVVAALSLIVLIVRARLARDRQATWPLGPNFARGRT